MGFIKAFSGAIGGTFADQWKDFYGPKSGVQQQQQYFKQNPKELTQAVVQTLKDLKTLSRMVAK